MARQLHVLVVSVLPDRISECLCESHVRFKILSRNLLIESETLGTVG